MSKAEDIANKLNKALKNETFYTANDPRLIVQKISSGIDTLDDILGGGWPRGRIVLLIGNYSSGKSLVCLYTIAKAQQEEELCVYIDAEKAFDSEWAEANGVDIEALLITRPNTGEEAFNQIVKLLELDEPPGIIVLDSIAALTPTSESEEEMEQQFMGLQARLVNKGLRKATSANLNTLIMMINQPRESIGITYGNPETLPGGKGQGFFSSVILRVMRGQWIVEDKCKVGFNLKFRTEKNKTFQPFMEAEIPFRFSGDVDSVAGLFGMAFEAGIIERKGPYYSFGNSKWLGKEKALEALEADKELYTLLRDTLESVK